jgi:hypothetical protein
MSKWGENGSHIGQGEIQISLFGINAIRGIILIFLTQENQTKACDISEMV